MERKQHKHECHVTEGFGYLGKALGCGLPSGHATTDPIFFAVGMVILIMTRKLLGLVG